MEEAEALSTRIIILEKGQIKTQGTVAEIKALAGIARIRFRAPRVPDDLADVEQIERDGNHFTLYTHNVDKVIRHLVRREVAFEQLQIIESSLESAFLHMMREQNEDVVE